MRYISTNNPNISATLQEAVVRCVAPDGGLYLPEQIPVIPKAFFNNIEGMSLKEIAYVVGTSLFGSDISPEAVKSIVDDALTFKVPLVRPDKSSDIRVLELFHGPTLTFKDFGARIMAKIVEWIKTSGSAVEKPVKVLVSTTGNTGAATANGFRNIDGIDVYVLFPRGVMNRMQEAQFTAPGNNIHALEVGGTIDNCKELVSAALADESLNSKYSLIAANSINTGRLLPQVVYYFQAYARMRENDVKGCENATYAIPCGNMSNLVAAVIAKRMGLPMGRLIAAGNSNFRITADEVLGASSQIPSRPQRTLAHSMDMTEPSNLDRLRALYRDCPERLREEICFTAVDDQRISDTINGLRAATRYLVDPHTATAYSAAYRLAPAGAPAVVLATGHPAKSLDIMTGITGSVVELPVQLNRFMASHRRPTKMAPTLPAFKKNLTSV